MGALLHGSSMAEGSVQGGSESQRGLETTVTHRQTAAPHCDRAPGPEQAFRESSGEKRDLGSQEPLCFLSHQTVMGNK